MPHIEKKSPVFGGGQRSSGVTRGQTLKTLLTQYLKLGNLDQVHTWYVDALWLEEEPHHVWVEVKGHLGSPGVIPENRINTIESSLPNIYRPPPPNVRPVRGKLPPP